MDDTSNGRVIRVALAGNSERRDLFMRILAESGSDALTAIDSEGVLTAFIEDEGAALDIISSMFASGMYPLNALELGYPIGGDRYVS